MRMIIIATLLVGLAAPGTAAAVPPYDASKIYPTEAAFMNSIRVYQTALAANPKDADAAYWLGDAYWEASIFYRDGRVPYGTDYLDRAIAALEQAVSIDDKYLAAWQVLTVAYFTRGARPALTDKPAPSDDEKSYAAALKVLALSEDLTVAYRGVPRPGARNGEVAIKYQPVRDRSVKWGPADTFVIADPDTKLVYRFSCAPLQTIKRPAFFLTKWEAFDRGYQPATVCPPP